jgi:hypothetical protein
MLFLVGVQKKMFEARLVIQHDPEDFAALPEFPGYLD